MTAANRSDHAPVCIRCHGSRFVRVTTYHGTHAEDRYVECHCQGPPLVTLTIRTRHPEHYVLLNEHDGSRWHVENGIFVEGVPDAVVEQAERVLNVGWA